jgi:hypothetical protein
MEDFLHLMTEFPSDFDAQALVGTLLSDGCLTFPNAIGNARFELGQGTGNTGGLGYALKVFELLGGLLAPKFLLTGKLTIKKIKGLKGKLYERYFCNSSCNSIWTRLRSMFYTAQGVKFVPEWVAHWGGPRLIAFLYMGDGNWEPSHGIRLYTNSFTPDDLVILQKLLLRHSIRTEVKDDHRRKDGVMGQILTISVDDKASLAAMRQIAQDHFHPTMMKRVGL